MGIKGTIANTLSFNLKGFQTLTTQQALYTNKFTTPDRFSVLYDSLTTATGGQLELGVKLSTKLNATLTTTYQKYKLTNQTNAWHLPNLKTNLTIEVHPIEKLHLTTDFFVLQGIKARLANGSATNLAAIIDLNLAAKYDIIKNLSLFANINNIIGKQYVQYYNYPNYGFNALGGLILKF
ncbi:MAG: TonB-dependent receptor [Sphingobacteriales bacterium]|nr:TonB-dependent receptor [Sphingobacteriales bacterium]